MLVHTPHIENTLGATISNEQDLLNLFAELAEPFRFVRFSENNFFTEFGQLLTVSTPIGDVELDFDDFDKLLDKGRANYFGLIKPTFQNPLLVVKTADKNGIKREVFIKTFLDKIEGILYFVSIAKDDEGHFEMASAHKRKETQILKMIREGSTTYQNDSLLSSQLLQGFYDTALVTPKHVTPSYTTLEFSFPYYLYNKNSANLGETTMQATQVKEKFSEVKEIPINELVTRPDLFQGRQEAFSQATYDKIVNEGYDKSREPIIVWYDEVKDEHIIISGHSRFAAAQTLYNQGQDDLNTLNVKEYKGTLEDAIQYATLESNRSGTAEGLLSDVIAYKKALATGCNKDCLRNYFKTDGYISSLGRLSYLNVEGDFLQNLNDPQQVKALPKMQQYAEWVGDLRKNYENLITNNHENEIFIFLFSDAKNLLSKDDFQRLIEDKVARFDFDPRYPLNLTRIKQKSNYEINAQASIQILDREIRELQEKRLIKEKKRANKDTTDKIKQTLNEDLTLINAQILQKLEEVEKIKRDIKVGERSQFDMFSSANIEYTPKIQQAQPVAQSVPNAIEKKIKVLKLVLRGASEEDTIKIQKKIKVLNLIASKGGLEGLGAVSRQELQQRSKEVGNEIYNYAKKASSYGLSKATQAKMYLSNKINNVSVVRTLKKAKYLSELERIDNEIVTLTKKRGDEARKIDARVKKLKARREAIYRVLGVEIY